MDYYVNFLRGLREKRGMTQEEIAKLYIKAYGIQIIMVRAFNHIGPRQSEGFVISDFANRIVQIEKGAEPVLLVGNLSAYRDFTDVRDIVEGYRLLIEKGEVGQIYNIGSGKATQVKELLELLIQASDKEIIVEEDPNKIRPIDIPTIECDNSKIKKDTGWKTQYNIKTSLEDILEFFREKNM